MDGRQFDDLVRDASEPSSSRREIVLGLAAGALGLMLGSDDAGARKRGRRNRRRNVRVCFKGREIVVNRTAARELVSRGAQRGACRPLPGGTQTCENPKLACDPESTSCGDDCLCLQTIEGGSICAGGEIQCASNWTCTLNEDCEFRFGEGYACVEIAACDNLSCNSLENNGCVGPCQS